MPASHQNNATCIHVIAHTDHLCVPVKAVPIYLAIERTSRSLAWSNQRFLHGLRATGSLLCQSERRVAAVCVPFSIAGALLVYGGGIFLCKSE